MPWEEDSPIAAGFGAAAGLLGGIQQGQQTALERKRQADLDRDHALAVSVAQQHQKFEEGRESSSDAAAADDTAYNRKRNTAKDAIDVTDAKDRHDAAQLALARAAFENSPQMRKFQLQTAALNVAYLHGQLDQQHYAIKSTAAQSQLDQTRADIAKHFGVAEAELGLAQTQAGIDSTQAGTAATRQNTEFGAQEEPIRQAQGRSNLFGSNLDNAGKARDLATPAASPSYLQVDPSKDPHAKAIETETAAVQKTYQQRLAKWQADHEDAKQDDEGNWIDGDGKFSETDPAKRFDAPPEDFESYTSALESLMQSVSKDPKTLHGVLTQIDHKTDMTPGQKAYAKRRIIEASKAPAQQPALPGGAPAGGRPFGRFEDVVTKAASEFGVPPAVLRAVGMQESGGGTTLTADGRSPDPTNAGHGWFQLDPASGAPPDVLARAAKDPVYATRVAANQLKQLYAQWGSWPAAIAAYNAGTPQSSKGQAYAQQVIGRIQ